MTHEEQTQWVLVEILPEMMLRNRTSRFRPPFGRYYTYGFIPRPFPSSQFYEGREHPIPTWLARVLSFLIDHIGVRLHKRACRYYGYL